MTRSVFVQDQEDMTIPPFWTKLLTVVALGKAAVAGVGAALAVMGALDIAFAATAQEWVSTIQKEYLNYVAVGGGLAGIIARIVFLR